MCVQVLSFYMYTNCDGNNIIFIILVMVIYKIMLLPPQWERVFYVFCLFSSSLSHSHRGKTYKLTKVFIKGLPTKSARLNIEVPSLVSSNYTTLELFIASKYLNPKLHWFLRQFDRQLIDHGKQMYRSHSIQITSKLHKRTTPSEIH